MFTLSSILVIFIISIQSSQSLENYYSQRDGLHVPCSFFDTVNITDAYKFPNGSYLYDNVVIPPHYVGTYEYIYTDEITQMEVHPHLRGCICKIKPCVSFCCPWGSQYNSTSKQCVYSFESEIFEPVLNVTLKNGTEIVADVYKQFVIQAFRPCTLMYMLQPEGYPHDKWSLFENGSIYRHYDDILLEKEKYCFIPSFYNGSIGNETIVVINLANCADNNSSPAIIRTINAYAMMFSIPFMVITILVYLLIPELRNQHGKSLVCYLVGLCVGYSLIAHNTLTDEYEYRRSICKFSGYTAYYFFMSSFLWLSIISFDLWHNFRGTRGINRFQEKKRFLLYSLYAWGLAGLFLVFTWYAEEKADIPLNYKPGIDESLCWLNVREWSAMIYFFGPIIIIICANIVMFVMTAMKIHHVQKEMAKFMARDDSNRNFRTEKDKFGLFLRLFIVMGVTWSMEILSYFSGTNQVWSVIFYVTDICNAIQGFLIFMLFVMKKKVKHLIANRCSILETRSQRQSQSYSKTTSSSVANLSMMVSNPAEHPLMSQDRTTNLRN